jgi:hypothetical protein
MRVTFSLKVFLYSDSYSGISEIDILLTGVDFEDDSTGFEGLNPLINC